MRGGDIHFEVRKGRARNTNGRHKREIPMEAVLPERETESSVPA